jgi:D-amino peptidase
LNVYLSVDMEGITGIVHRDMLGQEAKDYDRGRRLMTADAVAAVEGLAQAGATYVLVNDGHGPMRNLLFEEFRSPARLLTGTADSKDHCQVEAADARDYVAAVFVGYHAMAQTPKAIAPHTIAGVAIKELRINGRPHGETGLNAAVLGSLGIPVVMVTGDTTLEREARDFLGEEIVTVAVKEAVGTAAAICLPQEETLPLIRDAARQALDNRAKVKPYKLDEFNLEVDFYNVPQCDRAARTAGVERLGPMSIRIHGDTPWDQYAVLWGALRTALNAPQSWLA